MSCKKNKVMVAMSGGVDSFVAAALLLESGFDCVGGAYAHKQPVQGCAKKC